MSIPLQLPIISPVLKPFADGRTWCLLNLLVYWIGTSKESVAVPRGFVTDFASIPQIFWSLGLSPDGTYSKAALIHDWLYWTQATLRSNADKILLQAMQDSQVSLLERYSIYFAVRIFGCIAWSSNAKMRTAGFVRIVPERFIDFGPTVLWTDYQQMLFQEDQK